jgi:hypothetical protein
VRRSKLFKLGIHIDPVDKAGVRFLNGAWSMEQMALVRKGEPKPQVLSFGDRRSRYDIGFDLANAQSHPCKMKMFPNKTDFDKLRFITDAMYYAKSL